MKVNFRKDENLNLPDRIFLEHKQKFSHEKPCIHSPEIYKKTKESSKVESIIQNNGEFRKTTATLFKI